MESGNETIIHGTVGIGKIITPVGVECFRITPVSWIIMDERNWYHNHRPLWNGYSFHSSGLKTQPIESIIYS